MSVALCSACLLNASMPNILIRSVPPQVHARLTAAARESGQSPWQYVLGLISFPSKRMSDAETIAWLRGTKGSGRDRLVGFDERGGIAAVAAHGTRSRNLRSDRCLLGPRRRVSMKACVGDSSALLSAVLGSDASGERVVDQIGMFDEWWAPEAFDLEVLNDLRGKLIRGSKSMRDFVHGAKQLMRVPIERTSTTSSNTHRILGSIGQYLRRCFRCRSGTT